MDQKLYYTAPPQEIFDEVKTACIIIRNGYDNKFGYVDERIDAIKDIKNVKDNFMYMVAMFDVFNQEKLLKLISKEAQKAIYERLPEGYFENSLLLWESIKND
jgi:hypothetical protein